MLSSHDPAIRRGKNALPAGDSWPTFIFPASGEDIATPFASSAFLFPSPFDFAQDVVSVSRTTLSRRLEGSPLLNTTELRSEGPPRGDVSHGTCLARLVRTVGTTPYFRIAGGKARGAAA